MLLASLVAGAATLAFVPNLPVVDVHACLAGDGVGDGLLVALAELGLLGGTVAGKAVSATMTVGPGV